MAEALGGDTVNRWPAAFRAWFAARWGKLYDMDPGHLRRYKTAFRAGFRAGLRAAAKERKDAAAEQLRRLREFRSSLNATDDTDTDLDALARELPRDAFYNVFSEDD